MTAKTKYIYHYYLIAALILTGLLSVLRTVSILSEYDPAVGYFAASAPLATLSGWITLVAVLILASAAIPLARNMDVHSEAPHMPTVFSAAFSAFMLFAFGVFHLLTLIRLLGADSPLTQLVVVSALSILLSVASLIGFVLTGLTKNEIGAVRAFSFTATVLFCVLYTLYLYFETEYPMNADIKILAQIALVAAALYFLQEARIALGKPRWATRSAVGMIAMLLTGSISIPNLVFTIVYHAPMLDTPVLDFMLFGFFLYIFSRLASVSDRRMAEPDGFFREVYTLAEEAEQSLPEDEEGEQFSFFAPDAEGVTAVGAADAGAELLAEPAEPRIGESETARADAEEAEEAAVLLSADPSDALAEKKAAAEPLPDISPELLFGEEKKPKSRTRAPKPPTEEELFGAEDTPESK